ncbi:MAG: SIMPL domain-containing protein [Patescibacteria group bacterium]|nr:SIMPL domain-containing protein [Patescibacteria group bacterium]MDE1966496.1 SIMPL domain-containing protein [Patescibacteria group bacterium]
MKNKNSLIAPAVILGAALVVASLIGVYAFITVRSFDNTLVVTGSASQKVSADNASWSFTLSRQATEGYLEGAYSGLASDLAAAKKFLSDNGIPDADITIAAPMTMQQYNYKTDQSGGPRQFEVSQRVTVQSDDPQIIDKLSKSTEALTSKGILVMADQPQYFSSKLAALRVSLLGAALTDARNRAEQIASSAGTRVGALKAASSGVVQVLAPNSIDVSDYGQYDTSSIEKNVMVTVRATFFVK